MERARVIKEDGTETEVEPEDGKHFTLKELQKFVNGYIEVVYLKNKLVMVVNEEGMYLCGINKKATTIAVEHAASASIYNIYGNVLVCNQNQIQ
jgi:hypothetical protein